MSELIKALRNFITRDLLYVVGGTSVIAAFLYLFDRLPDSDPPIEVSLFVAGIGYVVGYAIQDGLSLTRIVNTEYLQRPPWWVRKLYRVNTGHEWSVSVNVDVATAMMVVVEKSPPRVLAELNRIITLKHVGTTMGSSGLVASVMLIVRAAMRDDQFDTALAAGCSIMTIVLILLAWLQSAHQTAMTMALYERYVDYEASGSQPSAATESD